MATRGRKPKPAKLKPGVGGPPEKPQTIANDAIASALWDQLAGDLTAESILAPSDGPILAALCSAYSRFVGARAILAKEGWVVTNAKNGAVRAHPLLGIEAGAAGEIQRYASELGLSPTARARVKKLETTKEVSLEDLLA